MRVLAVGDWRGQQTHYHNDPAIALTDPGRYILRLGPGGAERLQIGCNPASGRHHLKNGKIALVMTHATMATCALDSPCHRIARGVATLRLFA